jgi:hypothetical protein
LTLYRAGDKFNGSDQSRRYAARPKSHHHWRLFMATNPTFGRYAEIPYDQMTPEQQEGYHVLMETRGKLPGPAKIYVHNPKLAKVMGPFGAHFRKGYSLSERARGKGGRGAERQSRGHSVRLARVVHR